MSARVPSSATLGLENAPEVLTPVSLDVQGTFPDYVSGSLYRNGPGTFRLQCRDGSRLLDAQHWFDGLGMLHRFEIVGGGAPTVHYRSRKIAAGREAAIIGQGWRGKNSFAQRTDACDAYFANYSTEFEKSPPGDTAKPDPAAQMTLLNVSVTIAPAPPGIAALASHGNGAASHTSSRALLVSRTDANRLLLLDAETIEPVSANTYADLLPSLDGQLSAAHPCVDAETGDIYNFLLKMGPRPTYTVFCVAGIAHGPAGAATVLAEIIDAPPAYLHSLFMTKQYVVLCVWQCDLTAYTAPTVRNLTQRMAPWNPERSALFYVVDRVNGGVIAKYKSPPFFAFHTINAFEDGDDLLLDVSIFPDTTVIESLYLDNLRAPNTDSHLSARPRRFRLRGVSSQGHGATGAAVADAEIVFTLPEAENAELPTVHPARAWGRYRFAYGISRAHAFSAIADQLVKLDMDAAAASASAGASEASADVKVWFEDGCTPGEPIFVANPEGKDEDDGVLLSVVLDDAQKRSMLVCLDARTMKEIGRAVMTTVFPLGFHGLFIDKPKGESPNTASNARANL